MSLPQGGFQARFRGGLFGKDVSRIKDDRRHAVLEFLTDKGGAAGKTPHLRRLSAARVQGTAHVPGEKKLHRFHGLRSSPFLGTAPLQGDRYNGESADKEPEEQ